MAKPVINNTTSVLSWRQWQAWEYQAYAANDPASWSSSALPPGMTFDTATGLLSGTVTVPGVYLLRLLATNVDGTSAPVVLTIGIESVSFAEPGADIELTFDLQARTVTNPAMPGGDSWLLATKRGDDLLLRVRAVKAGLPVELTVENVKFSLKKRDPDEQLVVSSAWVLQGVDLQASYLVYASMTGAALVAALDEEEQDTGTEFIGYGEIELTIANDSGAGPASLVLTSQTFRVRVVRDQIP